MIKNEDCLFHRPVVAPYEKMLSLYSLRLQIAKDAARQTEEYISNFEDIITNIGNNKSENIGVAMLSGDGPGFAIFYEPEKQLILGVLKGTKDISMAERESHIMESLSKGATSAAVKYSKGTFVCN